MIVPCCYFAYSGLPQIFGLWKCLCLWKVVYSFLWLTFIWGMMKTESSNACSIVVIFCREEIEASEDIGAQKKKGKKQRGNLKKKKEEKWSVELSTASLPLSFGSRWIYQFGSFWWCWPVSTLPWEATNSSECSSEHVSEILCKLNLICFEQFILDCVIKSVISVWFVF